MESMIRSIRNISIAVQRMQIGLDELDFRLEMHNLRLGTRPLQKPARSSSYLQNPVAVRKAEQELANRARREALGKAILARGQVPIVQVQNRV